MANETQLRILRQGTDAWNQWRRENPGIHPDISNALLSRADLSRADLSYTNLNGADLREANLRWATVRKAELNNANLTRAILHDAHIESANVIDANLSGAGLISSRINSSNLTQALFTKAIMKSADLSHSVFIRASFNGADLQFADITRANISSSDFDAADLQGANLTYAIIRQASFNAAKFGATHIGSNDLSEAVGLQNTFHSGPSLLGIDTLYKSGGFIPKAFLRGCGVPEDLINFLPSIVGSHKLVEFYSCFISYSHKDEEFARGLYSQMRDANMRVWFAPEEIRGGRKVFEQIFDAIQVHDKLLLILSENSMKSDWVISEIRQARKAERKENRRKLFPIRLVKFEEIQKWQCFDPDSGQDLAIELREYFIPDFSNWKNQQAFRTAFDTLLRDLRAENLTQTLPDT